MSAPEPAKLKAEPMAVTRSGSSDNSYATSSIHRAYSINEPPAQSQSHVRPAMSTTSSLSDSEAVFIRPSKLSEEQRQLVLMMQHSRGKTSWFVPILFCCASLGKLILGFGASLAVKGHYDEKKPTLIAGAVLAALGLIGCVTAAIYFGAGIRRTNKRKGLIFKAISISGALFIGLGYVLNQVFVSKSEHGGLTPIRLSFLPLMLGTALMSISLPNFVAHSELLRGRTPIAIHRRPFVAFCCISPSLGSLFAGWVSGEAAEWQAAFNAVMLTVSIAGVLAGISLLWAGHIRYKAEHLELWLQMEETQERVAAYKRPASEDFNNEKPTATMVEDVSVPEIREPKQPC